MTARGFHTIYSSLESSHRYFELVASAPLFVLVFAAAGDFREAFDDEEEDG
jgi:hypothetical protein